MSHWWNLRISGSLSASDRFFSLLLRWWVILHRQQKPATHPSDAANSGAIRDLFRLQYGQQAHLKPLAGGAEPSHHPAPNEHRVELHLSFRVVGLCGSVLTQLGHALCASKAENALPLLVPSMDAIGLPADACPSCEKRDIAVESI